MPAVGAAAASAETAAIAAVTSTAHGALKAGTRIAAYARGIAANEFLVGSVGIARRACFAGKEDDVLLGNGGCGAIGGNGFDGFGSDVFESFLVSKIGALGGSQLGRLLFVALHGFVAGVFVMIVVVNFTVLAVKFLAMLVVVVLRVVMVVVELLLGFAYFLQFVLVRFFGVDFFFVFFFLVFEDGAAAE